MYLLPLLPMALALRVSFRKQHPSVIAHEDITKKAAADVWGVPIKTAYFKQQSKTPRQGRSKQLNCVLIPIYLRVSISSDYYLLEYINMTTEFMNKFEHKLGAKIDAACCEKIDSIDCRVICMEIQQRFQEKSSCTTSSNREPNAYSKKQDCFTVTLMAVHASCAV